MKSIVSVLVAVMAFAPSAWGNFPDTSDFVLVKELNGIALYERWYFIRPDEPAREVKATFSIKAPAHAAVNLIRDESKGTQWNKNTRAYKVLARNEDVWFGYIEYNLPWPLSNRDCVLHYERTMRPDYLQLDFRGIEHPSFPVQKKIERIPEISGKWIFKENAGVVDVEYYVTTTPNPTLPSWLTDPIIRNNLLETLDQFRELLEGPYFATVGEEN